MDLAVIVTAATEAAGHAAEEHEKSETIFFVLGGLLAAFAVGLSLAGMKMPDFPGTAAISRGIMALGVVLVIATGWSIIHVSG